MNEEVMALYKEKGVNPASGCVPMLLTFPFLFRLLCHAVAGHRDPRRRVLGWIADLSRPDPVRHPAADGATMFWQQKITPTSADPVQRA